LTRPPLPQAVFGKLLRRRIRDDQQDDVQYRIFIENT